MPHCHYDYNHCLFDCDNHSHNDKHRQSLKFKSY
ncbi:transcriptional regulator [Enterobacteriaceae bacterium 89]|nr:transcriptional regulator [Enterobacteriaceae bacterium 89]